MAIIYVVCAIFVPMAGFRASTFGWLVHLGNVDKFAGDVEITLVGFMVGLGQVFVYTYVGAWLVAWLHNKFCAGTNQ